MPLTLLSLNHDRTVLQQLCHTHYADTEFGAGRGKGEIACCMNYRLIAIQAGDMLKYDSSIREIELAAQSVFRFPVEVFPNNAITSVKAKNIHDWILTLEKQELTQDDRNGQLLRFLRLIARDESWAAIQRLLEKEGIKEPGGNQHLKDFMVRGLHEEVHKHAKILFGQGNFFHAVFEAAKAFNKAVQAKTHSTKDGTALMQEVWSLNGVLKLNTGQSQTERNVQDGVKSLAVGLMQALRNPTAHEPALDWPISKEECLDMLSFISYLYRQLDKAVYYKAW